MDKLEITVLSLAARISEHTAPTLSKIGAEVFTYSKPAYDVVDRIAGLTGQDASVVSFLLCILLSYPLGLLHRLIHNRILRHLYTIVLGVSFCFFVFKWLALHAFVTALVPYLFIRILPGRLAVPLAWIFGFGYLIAVHVYRMSIDYLGWSLDFSCIMMLVCLKSIACAYNVYDGTKPDDKVNHFHKASLLKSCPSLLEYMGFIFFYPSVLSGPVIEIKNYLDFIEKRAPLCIKSVLQRFALALVFMGLHLVLVGHYNRSAIEQLSQPFTADKVLRGDTLGVRLINYMKDIVIALQHALFVTPSVIGPFAIQCIGRFWVSHLVSVAIRLKYYGGWYLAEGACVSSGFGYSGKNEDGSHTWDYVDQADIIGVEFSTNLRHVMNYWNKSVARWLFNYVFTRVTPDPKLTGKRNSATDRFIGLICTFLVSALWHGLYSGYYLMWVGLAFTNQVASMLHDKLRPRLLNKKMWQREQNVNLYRVCGFVMTQTAVSYFAASFHLLSWDASIAYYNSMYWIGHFIVLLMFAVLILTPNYRAPKPSSGEQQGKGATKNEKETALSTENKKKKE